MSYATWRKCDFQIHTPRDPNWTGPRPIGIGEIVVATGKPAIIDDVDAARTESAVAFVDKCAERGLGAIAITDHHEMVMVHFVQQEIEARKRKDPSFDLWLFPGMELTASAGRQCLILFDMNLSEDWWTQAQGKLSIAFAGLDKIAARSPSVTQLTCTYADIKDELDTVAGLAGHFIVLPNVSQGHGHTVLVDKAHADFKRMACVGGYLDRGQTINTLSSTNIRRLSGSVPVWSERGIYPLPTSDSRSHDFSALGSNDTWIKLAEPTAEAIRQAFLGHDSRIRILPPQLCSLFVARLELVGSTILGKTELSFSAELNAIIGGRGSGKSSLLEYVAFGLGRSCYDVQRDQYSNTKRMFELVEETIVAQNAIVTLTLIQDKAAFKIVRGPKTSYQPEITYPNGTSQLMTSKELRALFPAVVYSQGELAEIGKQAGKQTQLSDLLQFVNADYKREDDKLKSDTEVARNAVRSSVQSLVKHWDLQSLLRRLLTQRDSLSQRIVALEKTLPTLSADDRAAVDHFDKTSEFESKRVQASKHADEMMLRLGTLIAENANGRDLKTPLSGEATDVGLQYAMMFETFIKGLSDLKSKLGDQHTAMRSAEAQWATVFKAARVARDAVLEKLGAHRTATAQIIKLREEATDVVNRIGDLNARITAGGDPTEKLRESIKTLRSLSQNRVDCTIEWAKQIEALSNKKICASVEPEGDIEDIRDALEVVSVKTGSQAATRLRSLDHELQSNSALALLDKLRADCLALLHWRQVGSGSGEETPEAATLFALVGDKEKLRSSFLEKLDTIRVEAISVALPKPKITLSYSDGNREIAFEKASEGQRAAALLFMLLDQPGGPLIIDQPEGDLDNKVIADLTEKLHSAKQKRQLIFVSHNANIVVNGSSELVAHLDVDLSGQRNIQCSGAIETAAICEVITSTMEGGERAFKARQDKYGY